MLSTTNRRLSFRDIALARLFVLPVPYPGTHVMKGKSSRFATLSR